MTDTTDRVSFPTNGWVNDISCLPAIIADAIREFHDSKSLASRCYCRSYKFATESYVVPAALKACYVNERENMLYMRCQCFRSQKKRSDPYFVSIVLDTNGTVVGSSCGCPAGRGACNHILGALRLSSLLQQKGAFLWQKSLGTKSNRKCGRCESQFHVALCGCSTSIQHKHNAGHRDNSNTGTTLREMQIELWLS